MKVALLRQMKAERWFLIGLLESEVNHGSWKKVFDVLDIIEKITVKDIQELVNKYLETNNRVIARIEKKKEVKK